MKNKTLGGIFRVVLFVAVLVAAAGLGAWTAEAMAQDPAMVYPAINIIIALACIFSLFK